MTRHRQNLRPAGLASLLLLGCGADQVDLGNNDPPVGAAASLVAYAGTWTGHAEAYTFSDGSDRVRITLDAEGHGSIVFGARPPPAAPSADRGYPTSEHDVESIYTFFLGANYPILEASVEESRLQLRTTTTQLFSEWCPLLTPTFVPEGKPPYWSCVQWHCSFGCTCDAEACRAGDGNPILFDGALEQDGAKLIGTLAKEQERIIVRLTRD